MTHFKGIENDLNKNYFAVHTDYDMQVRTLFNISHANLFVKNKAKKVLHLFAEHDPIVNLYINNSRVATEAELTKKMIAFAIALG